MKGDKLTKLLLRRCTNFKSCADFFERAKVGWAGKIHIIITHHALHVVLQVEHRIEYKVIIIRFTIRLMTRLPRFLDRALMEAAILWGWQGGLTLSTSQLGPKKGKSKGHVTPGWVWFRELLPLKGSCPGQKYAAWRNI